MLEARNAFQMPFVYKRQKSSDTNCTTRHDKKITFYEKNEGEITQVKCKIGLCFCLLHFL